MKTVEQITQEVTEVAERLEHYALHGEEYPDAEMVMDWAKSLRNIVEEGS